MAWDVRGKTALVTGGTGGIGFETALELAHRGARVFVVGRDPARTQAASATIAARAGAPEVHALVCDFASLADIRRLADAVRDRCRPLEILVNNAGGVHKTRQVTADGIESTFAVNHLGYFLLTNLLRDRLVESAPARVVTVASIGHRQGTMDFDDLGFERGRHLEQPSPGGRGHQHLVGGPPLGKAPHHALPAPLLHRRRPGRRPRGEAGGEPRPRGVTGAYFEEDRRVEPARLARDAALARRLWNVSARMVGLTEETLAP